MDPFQKEAFLHLFILQHGNHGKPSDHIQFELTLRALPWGNVHILRAKNNAEDTSIGVLRGGELLANEILAEIIKIRSDERWATIKIKASLCGHSLGGLFCRAALRTLFAPENQNTIHNIEWVTFLSLNSPHLGVQKPSYGIKDRRFLWRFAYRSVVNAACVVGNGITGDDLILTTDVIDSLAMDPYLLNFQNPTLVSLAHHDLPVPFPTASLLLTNPFPKLHPFDVLTLVGSSGFQSDYEKLQFRERTISSVAKDLRFEEADLEKPMAKDNKHQNWVSTKAYNALNKYNWRRILIDIGAAYTITAHDTSISKFDLLADREGGDLFLRFVSLILFLDHGKSLGAEEIPWPPVRPKNRARRALIFGLLILFLCAWLYW